MKKIILFIAILQLSFIQAQIKGDFDNNIKQLTQRIDSIVKQKNIELQQKIININQQEKEGKLTPEQALDVKKKLVETYADELDFTIYKETKSIEKYAKKGIIEHQVEINNKDFSFQVRVFTNKRKQTKEKRHRKRTSKNLTLSYGFNNVITNNNINSINSSVYNAGNSRFFELGCIWKSRILKENKNLFFRYGFAFAWHNFRLKGNKYHVVHGETTSIEDYPREVVKSRLRNIWFQIPMGIEINLPSYSKNYFKLGLGIYSKINLASTQRIIYKEDGDNHKFKKTGNYNVNPFNYGISMDIGRNSWGLYFKYDLISVFKNKPWKNISMGLKWEL